MGPARFDAIWRWFALGFGLFSPPDWALIFLVGGRSPLGLMSNVFLVYFRHIFCVIPTYPPANDELLKLVEHC